MSEKSGDVMSLDRELTTTIDSLRLLSVQLRDAASALGGLVDAIKRCDTPFQVGDRVVIKGDRGPVMTVEKVGRYLSGDFKGLQWVKTDAGETWSTNLLAHDPGVAATNPPVVLGNPFKGKHHRGPAVDERPPRVVREGNKD